MDMILCRYGENVENFSLVSGPAVWWEKAWFLEALNRFSNLE